MVCFLIIGRLRHAWRLSGQLRLACCHACCLPLAASAPAFTTGLLPVSVKKALLALYVYCAYTVYTYIIYIYIYNPFRRAFALRSRGRNGSPAPGFRACREASPIHAPSLLRRSDNNNNNNNNNNSSSNNSSSSFHRHRRLPTRRDCRDPARLHSPSLYGPRVRTAPLGRLLGWALRDCCLNGVGRLSPTTTAVTTCVSCIFAAEFRRKNNI